MRIRVGGNIAVHALEIPDGFVPNCFWGTATWKVVVPQIFVIYFLFFQCGDWEPCPRSQHPLARKGHPSGANAGLIKKSQTDTKIAQKGNIFLVCDPHGQVWEREQTPPAHKRQWLLQNPAPPFAMATPTHQCAFRDPAVLHSNNAKSSLNAPQRGSLMATTPG